MLVKNGRPLVLNTARAFCLQASRSAMSFFFLFFLGGGFLQGLTLPSISQDWKPGLRSGKRDCVFVAMNSNFAVLKIQYWQPLRHIYLFLNNLCLDNQNDFKTCTKSWYQWQEFIFESLANNGSGDVIRSFYHIRAKMKALKNYVGRNSTQSDRSW